MFTVGWAASAVTTTLPLSTCSLSDGPNQPCTEDSSYRPRPTLPKVRRPSLLFRPSLPFRLGRPCAVTALEAIRRISANPMPCSSLPADEARASVCSLLPGLQDYGERIRDGQQFSNRAVSIDIIREHRLHNVSVETLVAIHDVANEIPRRNFYHIHIGDNLSEQRLARQNVCYREPNRASQRGWHSVRRNRLWPKTAATVTAI